MHEQACHSKLTATGTYGVDVQRTCGFLLDLRTFFRNASFAYHALLGIDNDWNNPDASYHCIGSNDDAFCQTKFTRGQKRSAGRND